MTICAIVGCKKRSSQGVSLHRIPAVREDRSPREQELTKRRRAGFLAAIRRKDLDLNNLEQYRVCGKHFISGAPSALFDYVNPNWLPTVDLGHEDGCTCSFCRPANMERYARAQRRNDEQKIREDVFLRISELIFQETVDSIVKEEVTEILEQVQLADHSTITVADNFVAEFVDSCLEQIAKEEIHSEILRIAEGTCNCSTEIESLQEELAACHSKINDLSM